MRYYVVTPDGKVKPVHNVMEWAAWNEADHAMRPFEQGGRRVALTKTKSGVTVSTVFLGIDHNFGLGPNKDPVLFETMCYDHEKFLDYQARYSTVEEARKGHEKTVAMVEIGLDR